MITVTVTWMDGQEREYKPDSVSDDRSILLLEWRQGITGQATRVLRIPLHNVRTWTTQT